MIRVIPSIASADPLCYGESLRRLGDAPFVHLDLEDGVFLPNITFGMKTVRALAGHTAARLDAHLLVTRPLRYLEPLAECGVREAAAHIEALDYPLEFLERARALGLRAGLGLNLKTPPEAVEPFLGQLDYLIVMSAEPDSLDTAFRPYALTKLRRARRLLPEGISLWVDGGVGEAELPEVAKAGADTVIMGRAVWQDPDPCRRLGRLQKTVN